MALLTSMAGPWTLDAVRRMDDPQNSNNALDEGELLPVDYRQSLTFADCITLDHEDVSVQKVTLQSSSHASILHRRNRSTLINITVKECINVSIKTNRRSTGVSVIIF